MEKTDSDVTKHHAWLGKLIAEDRTSEESTCDLLLESEGKEFPVHKNIMMLVSKYFKKMFTIEMKEKYEGIVKMLQIPHQRLANLIEFIYSGRIKITEDNVTDILDDAEYTELEALKEICKTALLKLISAENCLKLRAYAQRYNLDEVFVKTNQKIATSFAAVVQQEDFVQLGADDMSAVIDLRNKNCEKAVLTGILNWVNHNPVQREKVFVNLFLKTDLSQIGRDFLNKVSKERCFLQNLVRNNLFCLNFLVDNLLRNQPAAISNTDKFLIIGGQKSTPDCVAYDVITKQPTNFPNCEESAFTGVLLWVNHNPFQREELFVNLFLKIDFSSMHTDFLHKVYKEDMVRNNLTCSNFLVENVLKRDQLNVVSNTEKFLIIGGKNSPTDCVAYNVITRQARNFPKLNAGRCGATSVKVGSKVYVTGGWDGGSSKTCEMLDLNEPTKWNVMPDLLEDHLYSSSSYFEDHIYVTGGWGNGPSCEKFDIHNNKWIKIKNMLHARREHGTVVCNGFIYCIGGHDGNKPLDSCERYDVERGEWTEIAPLNRERWGLASVVLNGEIYAMGGYGDGQALSTVERLNPGIGKWENIASLQRARDRSSACVVGNKIFVIGGYDGEINLKSVEVYDPTSNVWTIAFETEKPVCAATVVAI